MSQFDGASFVFGKVAGDKFGEAGGRQKACRHADEIVYYSLRNITDDAYAEPWSLGGAIATYLLYAALILCASRAEHRVKIPRSNASQSD